MNGLALPAWVGILSAVLGSGFAATFLIWVTRKLAAGYRIARDSVASFITMQATLENVSTNVAWMAKELKPNGGSSLRDSVTRTEQMVAFERIARRASTVNVALYERDASGNHIYVSPAFTVLTGLSFEECRDAGWSRVISTADRARALQAHAVADDTQTFYADEFTIRHAQTGELLQVRVEEIPVAFSDQLVGWLGRWVRIPAASST